MNIKSAFEYLRHLQRMEADIVPIIRKTLSTTTEEHHRSDKVEIVTSEREVQGSTYAWVELRRRVRHEINRVRQILRVLNATTTVEWTETEENGQKRKLTIAEALDLAKTLRDEIEEATFLGNQKSTRREHWNNIEFTREKDTNKQVQEHYRTVVKVDLNYDTKHFREEAVRLTRKADLLSAAIERADALTETGIEPQIDVYVPLEELALAIDAEFADKQKQ